MQDKEKRGKENYLRAIYELDEGKGIKSIEVARKLGISKASVSEMLRKLSKDSLIKIKPYSKILLTRKGKKTAEKFFYKHFIIKKFMKKFLMLEEEKAREEAHKLEHSLSEESTRIISRLVEENYESNQLTSIPNYVG